MRSLREVFEQNMGGPAPFMLGPTQQDCAQRLPEPLWNECLGPTQPLGFVEQTSGMAAATPATLARAGGGLGGLTEVGNSK